MKFLVFCDDLRFSLLRGHVGSSRVRRFAVGSTFTTYWIGSQEVVHMISSHGLGPKPVLFLSSPDGALFFAPLFFFLPFLRSIESDAPIRLLRRSTIPFSHRWHPFFRRRRQMPLSISRSLTLLCVQYPRYRSVSLQGFALRLVFLA